MIACQWPLGLTHHHCHHHHHFYFNCFSFYGGWGGGSILGQIDLEFLVKAPHKEIVGQIVCGSN